MEYIVMAVVSCFSSVLGAICGIGGGVIIKPVLDAVGIIPVETISFLSGCTVLSMSIISVSKNLRDNKCPTFDKRIASMLAVGAVIGGVLGKKVYQKILTGLPNSQKVGAIQAGVLLIVTIGTLIYTIHKRRIKTLDMTESAACLIIGCILGIISAFLGIGGGPINLVVLFHFFSMGTKQAAVYSLYIIMFSQAASLISSLITHQIPDFSYLMMILMSACGAFGGLVGSRASRKVCEQYVNRLFYVLMVAIILINIYNIIKYK